MSCAEVDLILALDDACDAAFDSSRTAAFDETHLTDPLNMSGRCDMHKEMKVKLHSHSMKQVVNITIALRRMKNFKQRSSEFGDDELLNIVMENVIKECRANSVRASQSYTKTSRVLQCSVCDQFQKYLVRSSGAPHLQAITLRRGNSENKVRFVLSTYVTPAPIRTDSQPVCLGISRSNLYLACSESDESKGPILVLKEISDTLSRIEAGDPKGFEQLLFYRKESGVSINTFESVKFPGWFISTAFDDYEQVEMCQTTDRITSFSLNDQELIQS